MIRQLQNAGPTLKYILYGLLLIICGGMVITLIPGGFGTSLGIGGPRAGVLATDRRPGSYGAGSAARSAGS